MTIGIRTRWSQANQSPRANVFPPHISLSPSLPVNKESPTASTTEPSTASTTALSTDKAKEKEADVEL